MKKIIMMLLFAALVMSSASTVEAAQERRGGLMGFIAGCCFGNRAGAAYNDGKEIHWREWILLVPYVNIVFNVWNGIDGANGMQSSDYAGKYGSAFY